MTKNGYKRHIIVGVFVFLLLIVCILFNVYYKKEMLINVSETIENEKINDISLTIYYLDLNIFRFYPVSSVEDLIHCSSTEKVVISGSDLGENIDLFRKVSNEVLVSVKKKSSDLDLRLYYVLESKKNGKLFDVAMWGDGNSIIVNGIEVEGNDIFYDVIMPFLPEDVAKDLKDFYNT